MNGGYVGEKVFYYNNMYLGYNTNWVYERLSPDRVTDGYSC